MDQNKVREMIKDALKNPKKADLNKDGKLSDYEEKRGAAIEKTIEKKTLKEEMHGGYLELLEMNPDFENGARLLLNAWFEWKEGPMTEPQMVDEAREDILAYLSSMMN